MQSIVFELTWTLPKISWNFLTNPAERQWQTGTKTKRMCSVWRTVNQHRYSYLKHSKLFFTPNGTKPAQSDQFMQTYERAVTEINNITYQLHAGHKLGCSKTTVISSSTLWVKKGCHPNHGYNFVNSWSICKILSLLQREVNFQQNPY